MGARARVCKQEQRMSSASIPEIRMEHSPSACLGLGSGFPLKVPTLKPSLIGGVMSSRLKGSYD